MADARELVPIAQAMIDQTLPIAEAATIEGDFTITLYIKRRNGAAIADANLAILRPRKGRRRI